MNDKTKNLHVHYFIRWSYNSLCKQTFWGIQRDAISHYPKTTDINRDRWSLHPPLVIIHHFSWSMFTILRRGHNGDFYAYFIDKDSGAQTGEASCPRHIDSKFTILEMHALIQYTQNSKKQIKNVKVICTYRTDYLKCLKFNLLQVCFMGTQEWLSRSIKTTQVRAVWLTICISCEDLVTSRGVHSGF